MLIHGWPLSGAAFDRNIPALTAAGLRVVTYDRRGFGASDKPATGYDYRTLAADAASVLEQLDLHDAVVLGFSMGAGEAAHLAGGHNERVAAVIFSGGITPRCASPTTTRTAPCRGPRSRRCRGPAPTTGTGSSTRSSPPSSRPPRAGCRCRARSAPGRWRSHTGRAPWPARRAS
ncbi:alpha/beta hydrolase [Tessaracoccus sp. HDW20]|uniref:alpha/beta fold hydrolase n=1 Tax=Tessaracoccus coleopterorum TaxID=2714950 RepID=UPI0018D2C1B1|nr:alpha/beta hydrolase [Tessaracoccus coleopterorum]